ncbi:hypothetical protein GCM10029963_74800 [Micromonospora andamanensis]
MRAVPSADLTGDLRVELGYAKLRAGLHPSRRRERVNVLEDSRSVRVIGAVLAEHARRLSGRVLVGLGTGIVDCPAVADLLAPLGRCPGLQVAGQGCLHVVMYEANCFDRQSFSFSGPDGLVLLRGEVAK